MFLNENDKNYIDNTQCCYPCDKHLPSWLAVGTKKQNPLTGELIGTRTHGKMRDYIQGSGEISFSYNVRLGIHSFDAVSNNDNHNADAAAKVMIPSGTPDPLIAALPCVARLTSHDQTLKN